LENSPILWKEREKREKETTEEHFSAFPNAPSFSFSINIIISILIELLSPYFSGEKKKKKKRK